MVTGREFTANAMGRNFAALKAKKAALEEVKAQSAHGGCGFVLKSYQSSCTYSTGSQI
jgi:hypothetical protein